MDADFWRGRWKENRIAFHEGKPNALLQSHGAALGPKRRVLVPLCGKAEDLAFLAAEGHDVVGVELVELAAQAFFAEHGLKPEVTKLAKGTSYRSGQVTILAMDFFDTSEAVLGQVNAMYDRAAIIALPLPLRERYARHLRQLMPRGSVGLVVTVEYDQSRMEGPPFSVAEAELRSHYAGLQVDLLEQKTATHGRLKTEGIESVEKCFAVRF